eukprot:7013882-Alexandrium_andersonii.AAC.1
MSSLPAAARAVWAAWRAPPSTHTAPSSLPATAWAVWAAWVAQQANAPPVARDPWKGEPPGSAPVARG